MKGETVKKQIQLVLLGALVFVLLAASCKKNEIASAWPDVNIVIDGDSSEWQEHLVYNEDKNVSFGVLNDDEALYICLVTTDINLKKQIVGNGLILWLDGEGGKHKTFGIKYPIGLIEKGLPPREFMRSMREPDGRFNDEKMALYFDQTFTGLQVLAKKGKESNFYTLNEAKGKGLEVKASIKNGMMTFEVKAPFSFDAGIASLSLAAAAPLGVGLETPIPDLGKMQQKMGAGAGGKGGGMGGHGGMGGGGRGGMGGRGAGQGGMRGQPGISAPAQMKMWTRVILAEE